MPGPDSHLQGGDFCARKISDNGGVRSPNLKPPETLCPLRTEVEDGSGLGLKDLKPPLSDGFASFRELGLGLYNHITINLTINDKKYYHE